MINHNENKADLYSSNICNAESKALLQASLSTATTKQEENGQKKSENFLCNNFNTCNSQSCYLYWPRKGQQDLAESFVIEKTIEKMKQKLADTTKLPKLTNSIINYELPKKVFMDYLGLRIRIQRSSSSLKVEKNKATKLKQEKKVKAR